MTVGTVPRLSVIPPDRGSFPLDHDGACKEISEKYVRCVRELKGNAMGCRHLAAQYMQCRIDNDLLSPEPLTNFGFRERDLNPEEPSQSKDHVTGDALLRSREERKESKGFIAGGSVVDNYAKDESYLSKLLSKFLN
ncbi:hypothetical protein BgAZ_203910 [Babesia gibsoni]|uniref:CHCH domain-containing protein n=1 Tax=Babesia gibsoni TaxID=33632 RepID=A0AAD8LSZ7_BABGI|nr:hypothetical protein BgAZ_203910 [Babesia gibsoni]